MKTAPEGSLAPRGGCGMGGECIEPPNQHRPAHIAQVAPALQERGRGVSYDTGETNDYDK